MIEVARTLSNTNTFHRLNPRKSDGTASKVFLEKKSHAPSPAIEIAGPNATNGSFIQKAEKPNHVMQVNRVKGDVPSPHVVPLNSGFLSSQPPRNVPAGEHTTSKEVIGANEHSCNPN